MKEQHGQEDTVCGGEGRVHPDWGQEGRTGGHSAGGTGGDTETLLSFFTQYCDSIFVQVATLANKFLHASYWFLVLGVTFSSKQLEGLARVARRREESSLESAKSLLGTLQKPNLADILKPDWDARESTARAVQMLELLDQSCEMSFHLHGANSSNQILPQNKGINRDNFVTLIKQNKKGMVLELEC